ncbi:hypothetical protein HYW83_00135 [Candidatus Peregrinibacteria bacterium]|nr:hypothetical protein [Candidatus Peregrinibacteria bacterium]
MTYYHDLITEKSFQSLQQFKRAYDFILIGGWAVYLYTKALKSRDIDFICDYAQLQKLKEKYDLIKNDRLKKYEIHMGEFDVDIYVPFFSDLGIPVEDLAKMTKSVDGFKVLAPETLLILKQKAHVDRAASLKGEKDKIDIIALLNSSIDIAAYKALLKKYKLGGFLPKLLRILEETREVPELNISRHAFARFKKKILPKLKNA